MTGEDEILTLKDVLKPITRDELNEFRLSESDVLSEDAQAELLQLKDEDIREMDAAEYITLLYDMNASESNSAKAFHMDVMLSKFEQFATEYANAPRESLNFDEITQMHQMEQELIFAVVKMRGTKDRDVSPELIDKMYGYIHSENYYIRRLSSEIIPEAIILDNRNKDNDEKFMNLQGRFYEDLIQGIVHSSEKDDIETTSWLVTLVFSEYRDDYEGLLLKSFQEANSSEEYKRVFKQWNAWRGTDEIRKSLREQQTRGLLSLEKYREIDRSFVGDIETAPDLGDLYHEIHEQFENYEPNQDLQKKDVEVLEENLKGENVLEIAFGTGRLLSEVKSMGKEVTGVDFSSDFVQKVMKTNPDIPVVQATWSELPFKTESFDSAYCLGRSMLHNTTAHDYIRFLAEAKRVLKKDGVFIVDKPDFNKGSYLKSREEYAQAAESLNLYNYQEGAIIDSADNEHFADRFVPSDQQFIAMSLVSGFDAKKVNSQDYESTEVDRNNQDVTYTNTNEYWVLTKRSTFPPKHEWLDALALANSGQVPLHPGDTTDLL